MTRSAIGRFAIEPLFPGRTADSAVSGHLFQPPIPSAGHCRRVLDIVLVSFLPGYCSGDRS